MTEKLATHTTGFRYNPDKYLVIWQLSQLGDFGDKTVSALLVACVRTGVPVDCLSFACLFSRSLQDKYYAIYTNCLNTYLHVITPVLPKGVRKARLALAFLAVTNT